MELSWRRVFRGELSISTAAGILESDRSKSPKAEEAVGEPVEDPKIPSRAIMVPDISRVPKQEATTVAATTVRMSGAEEEAELES